MYTSFYNLKQKPFEITSDPHFLWFGEKHKEALAVLKYGILNNKGILALTGDVGTGKTTLINALLESLPKDVLFSFVPDPNLSLIDFLNYIAASFGIKRDFLSKGNFLVYFKKFLLKANESNIKALIIIDESQLLSDEMLEQVRLLSNLDRSETKLLNIFFVGQNEFNEKLMTNKNRALRQRITINYNIEALNLKECHKYINYRLKIAGASQKIFADDAVKRIYFLSKGYPRRINVICDHCLLSGYVNEKKRIDKKIVNESHKDLLFPGEKRLNKNKKTIVSFPFLRVLGLILVFITAFIFYSQKNMSLDIDSLASVINIFEKGKKNKESVLDNKETLKVNPAGNISSYKDFNEENKSEIKKSSLDEESFFEEPVKDLKKDEPDKVSTPVKKEIITTLDGEEKSLEKDIAGNEKEQKKVSLKDLINKKIVLNFKYNTNDFDEEELKKVDNLCSDLLLYPDTEVLITGYTDSTGYYKYNKKLSEFRANIIKSYMAGKGIESKKIHTIGMAHKNPVAENRTSKGREKNRRVEIEVYQKDHLPQ